MSDEQENVGAGSETSGDTTETAQAETAETATETAQVDTAVEGAGGAAEPTEEERVAAAEAGETVSGGGDPDASRTGVVKGSARAGDSCVCPDGRPGTVAVFADGLAICLPNQG